MFCDEWDYMAVDMEPEAVISQEAQMQMHRSRPYDRLVLRSCYKWFHRMLMSRYESWMMSDRISVLTSTNAYSSSFHKRQRGMLMSWHVTLDSAHGWLPTHVSLQSVGVGSTALLLRWGGRVQDESESSTFVCSDHRTRQSCIRKVRHSLANHISLIYRLQCAMSWTSWNRGRWWWICRNGGRSPHRSRLFLDVSRKHLKIRNTAIPGSMGEMTVDRCMHLDLIVHQNGTRSATITYDCRWIQ